MTNTAEQGVPTTGPSRGARRDSGLLGAGVGYSLSPALHEEEAERLGLDLAYRIVDTDVLKISTDEIGALIRHAGMLGFSGLNVTYPHKHLVIGAMDDLDPVAASLQSVNTIVFDDGRCLGYNTDCGGFGAGLDAGLPDADLSHVAQFGCGGAGSATARALLQRGTTRLDLIDPDSGRRDALADHLAHDFPDRDVVPWSPHESSSVLSKANGIVNATPMGSPNAAGSPADPADLRADIWVADIVYSPIDTQLLRDAAAVGARTLDGGRMLVHQAAHSFELFHGVRPQVQRMREHFLALVAGSTA